MVTISESIAEARAILENCGVVEARRESNLLLGLALKKNRAFLIANPEYRLSADEYELFCAVTKRRSNREPFQHIAGCQEFYGLDFFVDQKVLIPRPETEMLVEESIRLLRGNDRAEFLEIGAGSGCIALSILKNVKTARAVALDISETALKTATKNARFHGLLDRVEVLESDLFAAVKDARFDLIVTNPPYVPVAEIPKLQAEVRNFDPHMALTDGADGLSIIRRIIGEAPNYLKPNAFLIMEIGFGQAERVRTMFDPLIWQKPNLSCDLQGIQRMVSAQFAKLMTHEAD